MEYGWIGILDIIGKPMAANDYGIMDQQIGYELFGRHTLLNIYIYIYMTAVDFG